MTITTTSSSMVAINHRSVSSIASSQSSQPQRSNSSGDLKKSAANHSSNSRRRSSGAGHASDHQQPSTIGSTMAKKKQSTNRHRAAAAAKSHEKKSKAGFEAWANARLTTSPVPASSKSSSSPVFMPTVVAPVWQPSDNILSLVHQADESPRLPPSVVIQSSSAPSSPTLSSKCITRIPCPPGFEHISASLEPLSTTCTPPCSPAARDEVVMVEPVVAEVETPVVAPAPVVSEVRQVVHDDFEIETSRVSCVVPTMMAVVPQQDDIIHTDPVSSPIVAAASYMGRTAAIRTLIIALIALAALGAVLYTSSMNTVGMGAAVPSVMLLAAFINRSSSPSLFDDDTDTNTSSHTTDSSNGSTTMKSLSTTNQSNNIHASSSTTRSSSHKGNRRSSRRRTSAH